MGDEPASKRQRGGGASGGDASGGGASGGTPATEQPEQERGLQPESSGLPQEGSTQEGSTQKQQEQELAPAEPGLGQGSAQEQPAGQPQQAEQPEELGEDLVHALIDDINEDLGKLVSDFFNVALPADAIVRVLGNLGAVDLVRCACVSKQWRAIAEEDAPWSKVVARLATVAATRGHG